MINPEVTMSFLLGVALLSTGFACRQAQVEGWWPGPIIKRPK